jgi:phage terminase large subunit GpA-like protein
MRKLHTFPLDAPTEYAEQMDAEVRVRDKRTGKAMWILPQGKKDNHALDCEVLSMLVAIRWGIVGRDKADDTSTETSEVDTK